MNDNLLWGKPELRFIVWNGETQVGSFDFDDGVFSKFVPSFTPIGLRHVLQYDSIKRVIRGYRFHGTLNFEAVSGETLNELVRLFQALGTSGDAYDRVEFYPSYNDLPYWSFDICFSEDDITTGFLSLYAHEDIEIRFESAELMDHVPLAESEFLTWGNMNLAFGDEKLDADYSTLP